MERTNDTSSEIEDVFDSDDEDDLLLAGASLDKNANLNQEFDVLSPDEDRDLLATDRVPLIRSANRTDQDERTLMTLTCFVCIALSAFLGDASRGLVVPSIVSFLYKVRFLSINPQYISNLLSFRLAQTAHLLDM